VNIELTLKNYRCFSDTKPARINIKPGFTAFIGINNSGKSSILKFFYEFRDLFRRLSGPEIVNGLNGNTGFNFLPEIMDQEEVFSNLNNRDLTVQIQLIPTDGTEKIAPPVLTTLAVIVPRGSNTWTCKMYLIEMSYLSTFPFRIE
jgi:AAA ATPase domain